MEPGLRIGIGRLTTAFLLVLVLIGVPLERKHAVRLLELVVGGGALDIEHGVVAARRRSHGARALRRQADAPKRAEETDSCGRVFAPKGGRSKRVRSFHPGGRAQAAGARSHGRAQEGGRLRPEPAQHATIGRALIPVVASSGLGGRHSWRSGAPDPARRDRARAAPAAEATADSEDLAGAHHRQQRGRACLCRRPAAADYGLSGRSLSTVAGRCHVTRCHVSMLTSCLYRTVFRIFSRTFSPVTARRVLSCDLVREAQAVFLLPRARRGRRAAMPAGRGWAVPAVCASGISEARRNRASGVPRATPRRSHTHTLRHPPSRLALGGKWHLASPTKS